MTDVDNLTPDEFVDYFLDFVDNIEGMSKEDALALLQKTADEMNVGVFLAASASHMGDVFEQVKKIFPGVEDAIPDDVLGKFVKLAIANPDDDAPVVEYYQSLTDQEVAEAAGVAASLFRDGGFGRKGLNIAAHTTLTDLLNDVIKDVNEKTA